MQDTLSKIIEEGEQIVFFGGAGVSTESGIPDFRSEEGLFRARTIYGRTPEQLLSHDFFIQNPEMFFRYYKENLIYPDASPNAAHLALAALEKQRKIHSVITQNIDGLHQRADSKNVVELHGSVQRNYCTDCKKHYPLSYVLSPDRHSSSVPLCTECGGIVRPNVTLYGESLDDGVLNTAIDDIANADVLIVGGTSLVVYPAAGLIRYFKGNHLVLINRDTTPYDKDATLVIHDSIGKVLGVFI